MQFMVIIQNIVTFICLIPYTEQERVITSELIEENGENQDEKTFRPIYT